MVAMARVRGNSTTPACHFKGTRMLHSVTLYNRIPHTGGPTPKPFPSSLAFLTGGEV